MPGQPFARTAFRDREQLAEQLHIGNLAIDMLDALLDVKHSEVKDRSFERVCYHGQLLKRSSAMSMLQGMRKFADQNKIAVDSEIFRPARALVEFNFEIVGLGAALDRATGGHLNAHTDHVGDIADFVGTTPQAVLFAARGRCVLIPAEFAQAIAIAASQVLALSQQMVVRPLPPNETKLKPLGGKLLEKGRPPYTCEETIKSRAEVIRWLRTKQQPY